MTQAESKLSRKILDDLRKRQRCFCFKVHGSQYVMAGLPDIIGCIEGLFFAIETKLPESRGNVSRRQAFVHDLIRKAGGAVTVACSISEAHEFVGKLVRNQESIDDG